jgi:hypothetical protein
VRDNMLVSSTAETLHGVIANWEPVP